MVNLSAITNMTPIQINTTIINNTETMIPNMISNANAQSDNWLGLMIMLIIYIWLFWELFNEAGRFRLDLIGANLFSSGLVLMLGVIMLVTNITTTFSHVIWFGIIFTLSMVASFYLKQKG